MRLVLASGSPRRREYFERMGYAFEVVRPGTEERVRGGETARDYVERNAAEKAAEVARREGPGTVVVSADTVVVLGDEILEKPKDAADARRMLRELSGATHQVMTGLCIREGGDGGKEVRTVVVTDVEFKPLEEGEIEAYIASGEPMDKAGAYAIQGRAAYMIREIRGSYTNVVGLPLAETVDVLAGMFGVRPG
jgi:septum formation protein